MAKFPMEPTLKFERRLVFLSHHLEIQTLNVISVINNVPGFFFILQYDLPCDFKTTVCWEIFFSNVCNSLQRVWWFLIFFKCSNMYLEMCQSVESSAILLLIVYIIYRWATWLLWAKWNGCEGWETFYIMSLRLKRVLW